jgi:hypothetical protein
VRLTPKHPPGRVNRKARAFAHEIARLRAEGYTCAAIRVALADIGVEVCLSTVQREAARSKRRSRALMPEVNLPAAAAPPTASSPPSSAASSLAGDPRTGKEIAAAFVSKHITNPLLRDRSNHEGRGH